MISDILTGFIGAILSPHQLLLRMNVHWSDYK